ncbi:MAG: hypothetical protein M1825_002267 [Sarcosagium campestre]|nr:MAG: hypothetical protein M1825_002267 [Sarcosagium campestre]
MAREELVSSAVSFLQDPSVASSPIEKRIAFLQSKNLTSEEVEEALRRAGDDSPLASAGGAPPPASQNYGYPNQQMTRQPYQDPYGPYSRGQWQQQAPPVPRRDWRDWFIMATLMGGVSYGFYFVAKRYLYPLIAPPTAPQLEQDKKSIDESFEKAFALLEQLSADTEALKSSEQARTERLDTALREVEEVIAELKSSSRRREEDGRRLGDEVRGLKELIPRALETQKESNDGRLRDLNTELKSLKTLVGNRMGSVPRPPATSGAHGNSTSGVATDAAQSTYNAPPSGGLPGKDAFSDPLERYAGTAQPKSSITASGNTNSVSQVTIPDWQRASTSKGTSSPPPPTAVESG